MTVDRLQATFEMFDDDFLSFGDVEEKRSRRPDLHAFLLLDELLPGNRNMVLAAKNKKVWLDVDLEKLAEVITEEQVCELVRCGVIMDRDEGGLYMFA